MNMENTKKIKAAKAAQLVQLCLNCSVTGGCVHNEEDAAFGSGQQCPADAYESGYNHKIYNGIVANLAGHPQSCKCPGCDAIKRFAHTALVWNKSPMTIKAFAKKFNFAECTIIRWRDQGRLKAEKRIFNGQPRWFIIDMGDFSHDISKCDCRPCTLKRKQIWVKNNWKKGWAMKVEDFSVWSKISRNAIYTMADMGDLKMTSKGKLKKTYLIVGVCL